MLCSTLLVTQDLDELADVEIIDYTKILTLWSLNLFLQIYFSLNLCCMMKILSCKNLFLTNKTSLILERS